MNTVMGIVSSAVHRSVAVAVRIARGAHPRFVIAQSDGKATANGRSLTMGGVGMVEWLLIVCLVALAVAVALTVGRAPGTDVPPPSGRASRMLAAEDLRAYGTVLRPRGARTACYDSDAETAGWRPHVAGLSPDCRDAGRRGVTGPGAACILRSTPDPSASISMVPQVWRRS